MTSPRTTRLHPARRLAAALAAGLVSAALLAVAPAGAAPRPAPGPVGDAPVPTIADALQDKLPLVSARAEGGFGETEQLSVTFTVVNHGTAPVALRVPRGTLLATDDASEQTAVVAMNASTDELSSSVAGDTGFTAPVGTSVHVAVAYCGQHADSGPGEITPMHYAGQAAEPLPTVLTNIAAAHVTYDTAQDAVWWVTDVPEYPVADPEVAKLLQGVDAKAFADHPEQVVADPAYVPMWAHRGTDTGPLGVFQDADGQGSHIPMLPVLVVLLAVVVAIAATIRTTRRPEPARATVAGRTPMTGAQRAGWYPDPWAAGQARWWDGQRWTDQHRST